MRVLLCVVWCGGCVCGWTKSVITEMWFTNTCTCTHTHTHTHVYMRRREPREPTRKSRRLEGQTAPHYNEEKLIMEVREEGGGEMG